MVARIYRPAKTAMQSGQARTKEWVVEQGPAGPRTIDPLMGWTSSADTGAQVQLAFDTLEEAVAFAERQGLTYRVENPKPRKAQWPMLANSARQTPCRSRPPPT